MSLSRRRLVRLTRRSRIAAASTLAPLCLAACMLAGRPVIAVPPPASSGIVTAGDTVVLSGARAFAAAELAYITAADGVGRLARAGVIRGEVATQVRRWNAEARDLLVSGKSAVDGAEKARAAATLFGLADRLDALTKGR